MATGVLVIGIERATKILGLLDRDRQVVRRPPSGWGRPRPPRTPKAKCCRRFRPIDVTDARHRGAPSPALRGRHRPGAVGGQRDQGRRPARLQAGPGGQDGRAGRAQGADRAVRRRSPSPAEVRPASSTSTSRWTVRRAPTSGRWPATSAPTLGVGGHLTALRRTRVGRFGLGEAHTLERLADAPRLSYSLDEACLLVFPRRDLTAEEAESARHGRALKPCGHRRCLCGRGARRTTSSRCCPTRRHAPSRWW